MAVGKFLKLVLGTGLSGTDNGDGSITIDATGGSGVASDPIWDTKGDLAVASGADAADNLPVCSDGDVLTADSSQTLGVKWDTPSGGSGVATDPIWDAKGDLAAGTGADAADNLTVGTDGQVLIADSAQTTGLR